MSTTTPPPDTSVKVPHLVLGLLFLGTAATWALLATGVVDADALPYLAPGLLVAAGIVGLAVSVVGGRRDPRSGHVDEHPVQPPVQPPVHPPVDQASVTMEDPPTPGGTRRLERQEPHPDPDPSPDGEPTAPLHRPEDLR